MEESISSSSNSGSVSSVEFPFAATGSRSSDYESRYGKSPPGLKLSWENLSVSCTMKISRGFWLGNLKVKANILKNVNGSIESGTLTAIMGPSGAGKTSLLAAISMRVQGNIHGKMLLNGAPVTKKMLTKISGFVPQQDLMMDSLTVSEHMLFMSKMKMDRNVSETKRKARVREILFEIGLTKCSKTQISGLSGGELKRLSLAVQLINNPPILFCDEPTTGLDSWAAATVVNSLKSLAESGRAVLCVLHQPSSDTFEMFHKLILVANGRIAYHGAVSGATAFFKQHGYHSPAGYNEAEFLVNIISKDKSSVEICSAWENKVSNDKYKSQRGIYEPNELYHGKPVLRRPRKSSFDGEKVFEEYLTIQKPSKLVQFYWLLWRAIKGFMNNKKTNLMEFLTLMGLALIVAIPFQNTLLKVDQQDIQNIQGLMYLIVTEIIFTAIYSVFHNCSSEVPIFLREVANDLYTPGPYYFSKILFMIPKTVIEAVLYTCLIYWIVGLKGGFVGFLIFTIPIIFAASGANAYGAWLSTSFESIEMASLVAVPIDFVCYLFAGNYINLNSVSAYFGWIRYLSVFFYSAEAVSTLQWNQIKQIECDPRPELPCVNSGDEVLKYFGYGKNNLGFDLLGLFGIYLGFHILAFISLWRRSKRQPVY